MLVDQHSIKTLDHGLQRKGKIVSRKFRIFRIFFARKKCESFLFFVKFCFNFREIENAKNNEKILKNGNYGKNTKILRKNTER